jgi:hypothetical protein
VAILGVDSFEVNDLDVTTRAFLLPPLMWLHARRSRPIHSTCKL